MPVSLSYRMRPAKDGESAAISKMVSMRIDKEGRTLHDHEDLMLHALYNGESYDLRGPRLLHNNNENTLDLNRGFNGAARFDHRSLTQDFSQTELSSLESFTSAANAPSYTVLNQIATEASMARAREMGAVREQIFVAMDSRDNIVGRAVVSDATGIKQCEIDLIYVDDTYRHSAVGSLLVRQIEDWAQARGVSFLRPTRHDLNCYQRPDNDLPLAANSNIARTDNNYTYSPATA